MKTMRIQRSLTPVLLALAPLLAAAQQEVMISQYMFNGLFINPAYAGSHPFTSASLLHRDQWTGMDGAPKTSLLAIDGPLWNNRMGLGFSLVHDRIGVSRDMEAAGSYAYRIRTGSYGRLAFGLKAGVSLVSARLSDLVYWDQNDPLYQQNIMNRTVGKFGFGIYWNDRTSYAGLSVPTLVAVNDDLSSPNISGISRYFTRHFYLNAGKVITLNRDLDLKTSVLVKYQPAAPPEVDINANMLFRQRFWMGMGYRTGDALVGMVEYQVSTMLRAGYAYDMGLNALRRYNGGSHEVMLGIDLGKDPIRIKSPRYF